MALKFKVLTNEELARFYKLRASGAGYRKISKTLGFSRQLSEALLSEEFVSVEYPSFSGRAVKANEACQARRKRNCIATNARRYAERIIELRRQGMKLQGIAEELGISYSLCSLFASTTTMEKYCPDLIEEMRALNSADESKLTVTKRLERGEPLRQAIYATYTGKLSGRRKQALRFWQTVHALVEGVPVETVVQELVKVGIDDPEREVRSAAFTAYNRVPEFADRVNVMMNKRRPDYKKIARVTGLGAIGVAKVCGKPLRCHQCGTHTKDLEEYKDELVCRECLCGAPPGHDEMLEETIAYLRISQQGAEYDRL